MKRVMTNYENMFFNQLCPICKTKMELEYDDRLEIGTWVCPKGCDHIIMSEIIKKNEIQNMEKK